MPRPVIDLTGRRFGALVVKAREGTAPNGKRTWYCQCDCGDVAVITGNNLRSGNSQTCGRSCDLRGMDHLLNR